MFSLLHLVDAGPPGASHDGQITPGATTLALLAESIGANGPRIPRVLLLGGRKLADEAHAAGIHNAHRLGVPCHQPLLALPPLLRRLRDYGPIDLVHCWSVATLQVASLARPVLPKVWSVSRPPDRRRPFPPLRTATSKGQVRALSTSSWAAALLPSRNTTVLEPALNPDKIVVDRQAIRQPWHVDGQTLIIALISEPATEGDAMPAALAAGQVNELLKARSDRAAEMRLLVHPCQRRRALAHKTATAYGAPWFVVQERRLAAPWTVLAGCDIAISQGPGAAGALWAMLAGVPVVAEAGGALREYARHEQTALVVPQNDHRSLAHQLTRLIESPQLRRAIAEQAQALVLARTDPQVYRRRLAEEYARAMGSQT